MKRNRTTLPIHPSHCLLSLLMLAGFAHAQNQTISGDLTVTQGFKTGTTGTGGGMELRLGGLMIAKGTMNSSPVLASSDEGAGTRLLWHPRKAAFRAGRVSSTEWDDANIGNYSTALGYKTIASGIGSTAMGVDAMATGSYSHASGTNTEATNTYAHSMGANNMATGYGSTAIGTYTMAVGARSVAMGYHAVASGSYSTATGYSTTATGTRSTAMGYLTTAAGSGSTAMGLHTSAAAHSSLAVGRANIGGGNPTSWVPTDPLFEIGNGTDSANRSNAITVYKNGNMDVQGAITCAPGGDIPMFGE